jgi:hypothetical protein
MRHVTSKSSNAKPIVALVTCRIAAPAPQRTPVLSATMLTGPGVIEQASANADIDKS